ncbi:MAG: GNAT family N-acetyltransferase [Clostridiales bacterium]|nr:GNAT family N-acetyltransferase [Clostridiales bacterium]
MELKQAILQSEIVAVKSFLSKFDLQYREDSTYTVYMEDNGDIVGTVSLVDNLIVCLAVDKNMQGENLAVTLVNHAVTKLREEGIFGYRVFTKPEYESVFINMGFNLLVKTEKFCALEGGQSNILNEVENLKVKVVMDLGGFYEDSAAIVLNGNPFTQGHLSLCEYALTKHRRLIIFVLEEDLSEFSFKERFSLAFLATRQFGDKVCVLPSTKYVVSKTTFPDYFLKTVDEKTEAFAEYDALIFKNFFMEKLGIAKRYFGSEKTDYMSIYNSVMERVLGDSAEFVDRFTIDGKEISAKEFRTLIKCGKQKEALELIPVSCRAVMNMILTGKKW